MKKLAISIALLISFPTLAADNNKAFIYDLKVKYNIEQPIFMAPHEEFMFEVRGKIRTDDAFYRRNRDHIMVRNDISQKHMKRAILHEKGHAVFYNELTEQQRQSWCTRFEKRIVSPTAYGRNSCHESFAESYYFRKYDWWATLVGAESLWEIKILDTLK